jgi:hypothetical protein
VSLHNLFWLAGIATEIAVVGLLLYRRMWRSMPVFFAYCIWALLSDAAMFSIAVWAPARFDMQAYFAATAIDLAMQFSVLVELVWSVLRPVRVGLSRRAIWVVAGLIVAAGGAIWPFAGVPDMDVPSRLWRLLVQMEQTASILRILFFVVLAGGSHWLSLGWRDRELQIASGFGFYSLMSVGVAVVNSHLASGGQFRQMYYVVAVSFLCSLLYWVFSFAQQEAERREFTPQMRQILLTLAESARVSRVALNDFALAEPDGGNAC